MSNYNILKTNIAAQIKQNGAKAITGQILQTHLLSMITSLGAGYQYMGVAALNTNPGTPDYKCFYIATAVGTYSNFGSPALTVAQGEVAIFYYDTAWHKAVTGAASKADVDALIQTLEGEVSELGQKVDDLDDRTEGVLRVESPEFLIVTTDENDQVLEGIKTDGTKIVEIPAFFTDGNFKRVAIDENAAISIDNPEYLIVITDRDERVLAGIKADGTTYIGSADFLEDLVSAAEARTDIISTNPDAKGWLANLVYPYKYNLPNYTPLSLAFITDIHANIENLSRFMQFCDKYVVYINGLINGGDIVQTAFNDGVDVIGAAGAARVMNVIGNHDVAYSSGGVITWDYYRQTTARRVEVYDALIGNEKASWGIVQPAGAATGGLCYYYKDFTAQKVRLIIFDGTETSSDLDAELAWVEDVLDDVLDSGSSAYGYSVVIAEHYNPGNASNYTMLPCNFSSEIPISGLGNHSGLISKVDDFVAAGGAFVCYLVGHTHRDYCGYITINDRKQLVVNVATGAGGNGSAKDFDYLADARSRDCFDIIGIDTTWKLVKIFRVGADKDFTLRKKQSICLNYDDCSVII